MLKHKSLNVGSIQFHPEEFQKMKERFLTFIEKTSESIDITLTKPQDKSKGKEDELKRILILMR